MTAAPARLGPILALACLAASLGCAVKTIEPAEGGSEGSSGATTTTSGGTEAGTSGDGDGDTTGDGDPSGDGDGDGEEETGPKFCPALDEDQCEANPECMSLMGSPLVTQGAEGPCLGPLEWVGCLMQSGCDDALTWACKDDSMVQFTSGCIPIDFEPCAPPPVPIEMCP